ASEPGRQFSGRCARQHAPEKNRQSSRAARGLAISTMSKWRHNGIVVREARPRDLDAIARLENESFETDRVSRRSLREFLRAAHRPVIAAMIDDELAGYALVSLRKTSRA